jgi:hypothetical protein
MSSPRRSAFETRYSQMIPVLTAAEGERLRCFGGHRTYARGERLVTTSEVSPGLFVILRRRRPEHVLADGLARGSV